MKIIKRERGKLVNIHVGISTIEFRYGALCSWRCSRSRLTDSDRASGCAEGKCNWSLGRLVRRHKCQTDGQPLSVREGEVVED